MELRPYQIEAKNRIIETLQTNRRVMLQLPTGAGKTILFVNIARDFVDKGKRVWILVHRKELIDQTADKLKKHNMEISVIQADYVYRAFSKVHIASVLTLVRRLNNVLPPDLIICDEAHHSRAETYKKIYANYPESKILGVTATPCRTNGEGFKDLFDDLICGVSIKQLIETGYLVMPKIYASPLPFDLRKVKLTAGDYNEKALYDAFEQNYTYGNLVKSWKDKAPDKQTIVFAINIEHSKHIVKTYSEAGIKAEHVDGTISKTERDNIISHFRSGETTVISNVGIITEGFDVPACECIQLVRPTKSLGLYLQMIGRGMRPAEGKENVIILDHANCVFSHGFPEQDRIWTLSGVKPNGIKKVLIKDRKTGDEYLPHELPKHIEDIELIELDFDELRIEFMEKLISESKKRGFKIGYAWYKFIEKYHVPTKHEIKRFQKIAEYKTGWCNYQYEQFGLN